MRRAMASCTRQGPLAAPCVCGAQGLRTPPWTEQHLQSAAWHGMEGRLQQPVRQATARRVMAPVAWARGAGWGDMGGVATSVWCHRRPWWRRGRRGSSSLVDDSWWMKGAAAVEEELIGGREQQGGSGTALGALMYTALTSRTVAL